MPEMTSMRRDVPHDVYRCFDAHGVLLYVGATNSYAQRMCHHRVRTGWWADVVVIDREAHPDRDSALRAESAAIFRETPVHNRLRRT